MTGLVHFEYAPPRSWEQFEELCADLFEAMWRDPNLVRHGRAGQVQDGVDIIAARGSIFPVGLQCKKKSTWPEKELKIAEVTSEINKADNFTPPLKELYILTTASADAKLQKEIRKLNISRERDGKFSVQVLFWGDLIRKIILFPIVARKHFAVSANTNEFSPLLATWYTSSGKVELPGEEWSIAVRELAEDFYDWPTGHVIIRQRETDKLIDNINSLELNLIQENSRNERLKLRQTLRRMKESERYLQDILHNIFLNKKLRFYVFDLNEDESDAPGILRAIIENALSSIDTSFKPTKIKLSPPTPELPIGLRSSFSISLGDLSVRIPDDEYVNILNTESNHPKKYYGNEICQVVSELPSSVKRKYVIPALINWLHRIMQDEKKTLEELDIAGYLDIYSWRYTY
jgi:hypothetical protein